NRQERRKAAAERRSRMMSGDEKSLPPRDRGPVKAYVRDLVDSRRHLVGLFMPLALVVFMSLLVPTQRAQGLLSLFSMSVMIAMFAEGVMLGVQTTRRVRERFPKEIIGGMAIGWYAFSRASQLRRLRIPKPRVTYGEKV